MNVHKTTLSMLPLLPASPQSPGHAQKEEVLLPALAALASVGLWSLYQSTSLPSSTSYYLGTEAAGVSSRITGYSLATSRNSGVVSRRTAPPAGASSSTLNVAPSFERASAGAGQQAAGRWSHSLTALSAVAFISSYLVTRQRHQSLLAAPLQAVNVDTDPSEPSEAATEEIAAGGYYFDACMECDRSWDKPASKPTNEPWRGSKYCCKDCGEDSFMYTPTVLAVADGVGGWAEMGVDPSLFANSLMKGVKEGADSGERNPQMLMEKAFAATLQQVEHGSATCLIAVLEPDGTLVSANMGDCGLVVIRGDECVHRTEEMQLAFNTPYQLSTEKKSQLMMPANSSKVDRFQTQPGDLVILGSDGLFDNLHLLQLLQVIKESELTPEKSLAELIKLQALEVTRNRTVTSPFAMKAIDAGYWYLGGKPDDITVVVGRVMQRS